MRFLKQGHAETEDDAADQLAPRGLGVQHATGIECAHYAFTSACDTKHRDRGSIPVESNSPAHRAAGGQFDGDPHDWPGFRAGNGVPAGLP